MSCFIHVSGIVIPSYIAGSLTPMNFYDGKVQS